VFYLPECDAVHFENLIRWDLVGNIILVLKKGEEKAGEIVLVD
jgi:hypothetical protein